MEGRKDGKSHSQMVVVKKALKRLDEFSKKNVLPKPHVSSFLRSPAAYKIDRS